MGSHGQLDLLPCGCDDDAPARQLLAWAAMPRELWQFALAASIACTTNVGKSVDGTGADPDARPVHDAACTPPPVDCPTEMTVNGTALTEREVRSVTYVAERVMPSLLGCAPSREEALDDATIVSWWSLKEGVFNTPNPIGFSLCDRPRVNLTDKPLDICDRDAWQVGIAAIQSPRPGAVSAGAVSDRIADMEALVDECMHMSVDAALRSASADAGNPPGSTTEDAIADSASYLRASWLLRVGPIAFIRQAPIVRRECIDDTRSWCFGDGWSQSASFAKTRSEAEQSQADLRQLLDSCTAAADSGCR